MASWEDAPTVRLTIPSRRPGSVAWRLSVAVCVTMVVLTAAGVGGLWWQRSQGPALASLPVAPVSTPVAPVVRDLVPTTRPVVPTRTTSTTSTSTVVSAYAGEWQSHGFSVTFEANGRGKADFRTYVWCSQPKPGVPCEDPENLTDAGHAVVQLQATSSGTLRMRVVSSNDQPDWPTGTTFTVTPKRRGVLQVSGADGSWGLCQAPVSDPICGA